jgi:ribonucleoside-diphosphate reductase beta chain
MITITKRNGRGTEPFTLDKIITAVTHAKSRTDCTNESLPLETAIEVESQLREENITSISVDDIHRMVEDALMDLDHATAREYITYRKAHMPDLFRPRAIYRPFEYPDLHKYVDAIRQSYWTHDEFDFTADIQDFLVNLNNNEREVVRRCMLAIAHVEATVKTFWSKLGDRIDKPEIAEVGITFGESEVRHANAYAELLNVLGLNNDFAEITNNPIFIERKRYMSQALSGVAGDNREYLKTIAYFSLFIENVSLFSQFLIIMMINHKQGYLKGMSNTIGSTALEENLHAMFGADLVKTRRIESPEWFDDTFNKEVRDLTKKSYQAELSIIDWIFELGPIDAVSKEVVTEYIKSRFNKGLLDAGFDKHFDVDDTVLEETEFFDLQVATTTHVDFFHKKSSNYTKKSASFDADSLF